MRNLKLVNKLLKHIEYAEFYDNSIFSVTKVKNSDGYSLNVYEINKSGTQNISLTHHKKAQALATIHNVGMMICVDVDRTPYYYFY